MTYRLNVASLRDAMVLGYDCPHTAFLVWGY